VADEAVARTMKTTVKKTARKTAHVDRVGTTS